RLRTWLDDIIRWMRGVGRRARGRVQRFTRPRPRVGRGRPGARAPPRRRPSRRGGRRRDRDGRRDRDRDDRRRRRLERALPAIRRSVRGSLRDGVGKQRLLMKLRYLRIRYRIRVLRLLPDGTIEARNSPPRTVVRARRLRPYDLGRLIRPVLEAAEARFRRQLAGDSAVAEARERVSSGGTLDPDGVQLTRSQRAEVMRQTPLATGQRGDFGGVTGYQSTSYANPQSPSFTVLDVPGASADTYPSISAALVQLRRESGLTSRQISRILASRRSEQAALMQHLGLNAAQQRLLTAVAALDDLERARQGSVGTANAVARRLGASG